MLTGMSTIARRDQRGSMSLAQRSSISRTCITHST
jgi:hypothetical protein